MTGAAYRVDGRQVPQADFYAVACDPARSVVVEACAGAGKTWMLVSRMLRALLDGTEPQRILAITFTRRAAAEMRQRLDEWLQAHDVDACDDEARVQALVQRGLGAAQARAQQAALGTLGRRLRQAGRGVEVRTFHAWFAQLAAQMPIQMRAALALPAEFTLLEDPQPLRTDLMRRLRRRVLADAQLTDDHAALQLRHGRSRVDSWLDLAWQRADELALADAAGVLDGAVPSAADWDRRWSGLAHPLQVLDDAAWVARWRQLAQQLGRGTRKVQQDAATALADALQAQAAGHREHAFERAWDALYTRAGTPRKQLDGGPLGDTVCDELAALQAACAQQQAHDDHQRMVRLSRVLRAEYAALKRLRGVVDMPDLERAAHLVLSDPQTAGWVAQRLDQRVQQLLIDEFQDTSPLQWHALYGWLSAYAGAGGGASGQRPPSVFIVGDPKQSVYRFRRAEPRVFDAARAFVVEGLGGQALACDHTRRNAPAVVAAVNTVFADAAALDGWGPFRAHTTESTAAGAVLALPEVPRPVAAPRDAGDGWRDSLTEPRTVVAERARATEARQVACSITQQLAQGVPPRQIMVLARQRSVLRAAAEALSAAGVACLMPEALVLAESPEAQDLVAVLDVLASPAHDLSLARALRSPLFGCSDDDLMQLAAAARTARQAWLEALVGRQALATPSSALARAARLLAGWQDVVHELAPHDLLDRIVHESEALARTLAAVPPARRHQARQAIQGLLQAALDHGAGRFVSTYAFVRAVRLGHLKTPASAAHDAVQLLTVHGAKGLEADVVYLMDARPEARSGGHALLLTDWPVEEPAPRRVAFVASDSRPPPALADALAHEAREGLREEVNALYVALTRARRGLVVSRVVPHRAAPGRSWWDRLAPSVAPIDAPTAATAGAAAVPATVETLPARPADAAADATAVEAPALDAEAAALGRAVHRLLEWIGQPGVGLARSRWPDAARQAALAAGVPAQAGQVLSLATTIADSPACAHLFGGPALRWAGNEVPMGHAGQALRLDRLVQLADGPRRTWWVLDYKLGRQPQLVAAHRQQLAAYRDAVRAALAAAGDDDEVRAAFVTGGGALVEL